MRAQQEPRLDKKQPGVIGIKSKHPVNFFLTKQQKIPKLCIVKAILPAIILVLTIVGIFYLVDKNSNKKMYQDINSTSKSTGQATPGATPANTNPVATIEMVNGGIIKIELFPNLAPNTVTNFTKKANSGYYDNLTFHRVENWVVQGGDPKGNGTGGGNQPTELSKQPFKTGAVGIARGPDIKVSNDSQFFIVKLDSDFLDNLYTNFGQVISGMDVVNSVQIGDVIRTIRVQ